MSMSWSEAGPLDRPLYQPLDSLSRSLHFPDLDRCYKKGRFIPHKISSKVMATHNIGKVLWFAPSTSPSEHNMYGNVTFTIPMKDVVDRFGGNYYYLDALETSSHTATRVLLTQEDYDYLEAVDFYDNGSPLKRNRWRHVSACDSDHSSSHPHYVEIGIEVDNENCKWLYEQCDVEANDHSRANTRKNGHSGKYFQNVCHRYNLFGRNCPYDFTVEETQGQLDNEYPELFSDDNSDEEPAWAL